MSKKSTHKMGRLYLQYFIETLDEKNVSEESRTHLLRSLKVEKLEDLTMKQAKLMLMQIELWEKNNA